MARPRVALRLVALACLALILACTPSARQDGPALWRLADEDSEIWLFGTVHVLPPDLVWRTPVVESAFAEADTVVFEADVESAGARYVIAALVARHGGMPKGEWLSARLDPETQARFDRVAQSLGYSSAQFQAMRPWLAALQLSLRFTQAQGGDANAGVEAVLGREAARAGKRLDYLETADEQIGALARLPPADEVAFLAATLRQIEEEAQSVHELDRAWASGDLDALARLSDRMIGEAGPVVKEAILTRRNRAWTERIARLHAGEGRFFIAVGAAHLVGEDNVIDMLRARGLEVERQ